jgi:hypothetical protein
MTTPLIQRDASARRWAGLILLFWASTVWAEAIRVATWNPGFAARTDGTPLSQDLINEAAAPLKSLNPDVVLLQGIPDKETCLALTEALKLSGYTLAVCSSFGAGKSQPATNIAGLEELKRSYQSRVASAQADLISAQRALAERQEALGTLGRDLLAQGAIDWPEVSSEKVSEYADVTKELDKLKAQERELLRRGYKDAHPLVQSVRTLLRSYSSQRVELERSFPTLKYLANNGDVGTNAAAQDIVEKLTEIRKLKTQVTTSGAALSNVEYEASRILNVESQIAEAERLRLEQQKAAASQTQVAILVKGKVISSETESWGAEGEAHRQYGFAFAIINIAGAQIGCLSVHCNNDAGLTNHIQRLVEKTSSIRSNTERSAVLAGFAGLENGEPSSAAQRSIDLLRTAGLVDCLRDLPSNQRAILASSGIRLFTGQPGYPFNPQLIASSVPGRSIAICEVELDPMKIASALNARNELSRNQRLKPLLPNDSVQAVRWVYVGGGVVVLLCLAGLASRIFSRRSRGTALTRIEAPRAITGSAYTVVLAPKPLISPLPEQTSPGTTTPQAVVHVETPIVTQTQSASWQRRALAAEEAAERANALLRQGLLPELSRWLKQKLVRKLISDRAELLTAQQAAARQVQAVDERLARIEAQIQVQTQAYIRRIEQLTAELNAAKEENRELIRARIAQVKTEMEAARERLLKAETNDEQRP